METPHPGIEIIEGDNLRQSDRSTPAETREIVFETPRVLLERVEQTGETTGEWRHHDDHDAYGVVLSGQSRVEYGSSSFSISVDEFLYIPAGVSYRLTTADEKVEMLITSVEPGQPEVTTGDSRTEQFERTPQRAGTDDLASAGELKNLTRLMPFPEAPVQQVRGHASGRVASDWHHHGDNDVLGYVLDGEGYVEDERALARAGEFFHISAGVVHRDVNPSDDEQDYVLWLTGSEPRTIPVDGPAD
ncbi:cupin domain-containing protein [Halococcus salsus]|uniref:cupin domain-containing protein n=1 Tax=Halococcus salsus TaxID=2162894 RepID=UPI00135A5403|nr:cupin domain-containing protein [Halococcus salsus]